MLLLKIPVLGKTKNFKLFYELFEKYYILQIVTCFNIITIYGVFFFTLLNFSDTIANHKMNKIKY